MSDNDSDVKADRLDDVVRPWAERISRASTNSLEAILTRAESVCAALNDLSKYGKKARTKLQQSAHISQSEMSKLEKIGKHAELFRSKFQNLPASMSSLYVLAGLPEQEMRSLVDKDLRMRSRSKLLGRSSGIPALPRSGRLFTISFSGDHLDAEQRRKLIEEIRAAVETIVERYGIRLALPATNGDEADQTPSQPVLDNQRQAA